MMICGLGGGRLAEFDVVVIGGGTGGYVAAIRAAQLGMSVAVVERHKLGGTCLHQGCIPSKALLRSAEIQSIVKNGEVFGLVTENISFSLGKAMQRKDAIVNQLYKGVQFLMKKHGITVIEGVGHVMGSSIFSPTAGAVRVQGVSEEIVLTPRFTVIATGSRPRAFSVLPFDGEHILSSEDVLRMTEIPTSVIIIGGGSIGVEWASMFADFGSDVTLIESQSRILGSEDEDISSEMLRLFRKRGVKVITDATVVDESQDDHGVTIRVNAVGKEMEFTAQRVVVAIGRSPNTEGIGLDAAGVTLQDGFIVVDDQMKTAENNIYAIGDVIGRVQLAHVAAYEGVVAIESIAGLNPDPLDYGKIARCTYGRPEVASVGISEHMARQAGFDVRAGKFSFKANGKALIYGEADGFVKVVSDQATGDVLGVHMIGPQVTNLISEAALAQILNATPWEISRAIHPHPTLSEVLGEASLDALGQAIHG